LAAAAGSAGAGGVAAVASDTAAAAAAALTGDGVAISELAALAPTAADAAIAA
jgi:hypothetical protein